MSEVKWSNFLKDVFITALGSYGGPEAHYGVFQSQLVDGKEYLTEEELTELIGLYSQLMNLTGQPAISLPFPCFFSKLTSERFGKKAVEC